MNLIPLSYLQRAVSYALSKSEKYDSETSEELASDLTQIINEGTALHNALQEATDRWFKEKDIEPLFNFLQIIKATYFLSL